MTFLYNSVKSIELMNRESILNSCREYFKENFLEKDFIPGETYIPVTVKKLSSDDLVSLIDSSLDLWLTSGRYGKEFEASLAQFFGIKTQALLVNSGSSANLVALSSLGSP